MIDIPQEKPDDNLDYLVNPDDKESLSAMKHDIFMRVLWNEINDAAQKEGKSYGEYLSSLDDNALEIFIARARVRAVSVSSQIRGLSERVNISFAYDTLRKNAYRLVGEYDNFLQFLQDKLDNNPSSGSAHEINFILGLIETYETMGKHEFAQKLFSNPFAYGKFVATISALRKKTNAVVAAQQALADAEDELDKKVKTLRKESSNARSRGEGEKVLNKYSREIKEIELEKEKLHKKSRESIELLEVDLMATTAAAVDLAGKRNVRREDIPSLLVPTAKVYIKNMGYDPKRVSAEYTHDEVRGSEKMPLHVYHDSRGAVLFGEIPKSKIALAMGMLSGFDIKFGTPEDFENILMKRRK